MLKSLVRVALTVGTLVTASAAFAETTTTAPVRHQPSSYTCPSPDLGSAWCKAWNDDARG